VVTQDGVFINCQLTGDPAGASDIMALSVDGDPPYFLAPTEYTNQTDRSFRTSHVELGLHQGKVWRTKVGGLDALPGSEMTFRYVVEPPKATPPAAEPTPTPTPTPTPIPPAAAPADTNTVADPDANSTAAARADTNTVADPDANSAAARADPVVNTSINGGASTTADTNADADPPAGEAEGDAGDAAKKGAQESTGTPGQSQGRDSTTGRTVVDVSRRGGQAIRGSLSDMFARSLRRVAHSMTLA
jgi:hypothetical protein